MTEILIILPIDTIDPTHMDQVIDKFIAHKPTFDSWAGVNNVWVFGPSPFPAPVAGSREEKYNNKLYPGQYLGNPTKIAVTTKIQSMWGAADRVIYIDDHSELVEGAWNLSINSDTTPIYSPTLQQIANDQNLLGFEELNLSLGGNRAHLICRGFASGEAVITNTLAITNRNIYCSMHHLQDVFNDQYDLHSANNLQNLESVHDAQSILLMPGQTPQKWIGITN